MEDKKSFVFPLATIIVGILMQMKALGVLSIGGSDLLNKLWPLLIIVAGLDLLFCHRRYIAAGIVLFTGVALLSAQFLDGQWSSDLWKLFVNFWPLLMIIFGVDCIFKGRSVISVAVIVVLLLAIGYAIAQTAGIDIMKKIPQPLQAFAPEVAQAQRKSPNQPATVGSYHIDFPIPSERYTRVNLQAPSGKVQMQAGNIGNRFMSGIVRLNELEMLDTNQRMSGNVTVYDLKAASDGASQTMSDWDLSINPQVPTALNLEMSSGYMVINLQNLSLTEAKIENQHGPVDIKVPTESDAPIRISGGNSGNIRIFVSAGSTVSAKVRGTTQVSFPPNYSIQDGVVSAEYSMYQPVNIEIESAGDAVEIITVQD